MRVTVVGAGNSGLAMAAHVSLGGHQVTLWNRTRSSIERLIDHPVIHCDGVISGHIPIHRATSDISSALEDPDLILITTPAYAHRDLADLIARNISRETLILLNPGRTFGALEFRMIYEKANPKLPQTIAEAQTIIYTCRRTGADTVHIVALKSDVLLSTFKASDNAAVIARLPACIRDFFIPARSMIETSIGNVGMILHCAPLLLNAGWTENETNIYKYYYDGITPTISGLLEKLDHERIGVSRALDHRVETTREWLKRTYHITGETLYECLQNNEAYKKIDAPQTLQHRYILEDVPCGLVPLEAVGLAHGVDMSHTSLIIDLASRLMGIDFRKGGRNLESLGLGKGKQCLHDLMEELPDA
jgi:opine dehydrogenase